jgi:hypothetical protein
MNKDYFLKRLPSILIYFFVASFILLLLWNWLLPSILNLSSINYLQSCGLLLLTNIFCNSPFLLGRLIKSKKSDKEKWSDLCDDKKEKLNEMWEKRCEEILKSKKQE